MLPQYLFFCFSMDAIDFRTATVASCLAIDNCFDDTSLILSSSDRASKTVSSPHLRSTSLTVRYPIVFLGRPAPLVSLLVSLLVKSRATAYGMLLPEAKLSHVWQRLEVTLSSLESFSVVDFAPCVWSSRHRIHTLLPVIRCTVQHDHIDSHCYWSYFVKLLCVWPMTTFVVNPMCPPS
jgi:hypothetical protein